MVPVLLDDGSPWNDGLAKYGLMMFDGCDPLDPNPPLVLVMLLCALVEVALFDRFELPVPAVVLPPPVLPPPVLPVPPPVVWAEAPPAATAANTAAHTHRFRYFMRNLRREGRGPDPHISSDCIVGLRPPHQKER